MVQTDELLRTKKKETNLISPTSRETFFTDKDKFPLFWQVYRLDLF